MFFNGIPLPFHSIEQACLRRSDYFLIITTHGGVEAHKIRGYLGDQKFSIWVPMHCLFIGYCI